MEFLWCVCDMLMLLVVVFENDETGYHTSTILCCIFNLISKTILKTTHRRGQYYLEYI